MITRLMLSLKKAASRENGWLFSEMTTVRRVDELSFVRNDHTQPPRAIANAQKGLGRRGTEVSEGSVNISEGIAM